MKKNSNDTEMLNPKNEDIILANFKEQFFKENLQPDHSSKVFQDDIVVQRDDILNLNDLIIERLKKYSSAGLIVQVYIKLSNKKQILFASWKEFEDYKWLESTSLSRIVITWKFNAVFPGYDSPQKHTLTVKLSNSMRPDELFKMMLSGELDEIDDFETNIFPVYSKVNFINRSLGDELLDTVGEWVNGLSESDLKKNKFIMKMKKRRKPISQSIEIITFSALLYGIVVLFLNRLDNLNITTVGNIDIIQLKSIFLYLALSLGLIYIIRFVSNYIGVSLFRLLGEYGKSYIFCITKGDRKKLAKLKKEDQYDLINITIRTLGALSLDVIVTILASMFFR